MKNTKRKIKGHLDLFSGIGGFSLGLERAGVEPEWIGYSDIDKNCNQVFKRRFQNAEELGSITDIRTEELPEIDLVTFGFPCQDLSVANINRKGLKGGRSSLFFEAVRIIRDKKPKHFICENVRGLFSSNKGQDFIIVLQEFADIGYDVQWELLNTKCEGGLPQNRERIYIVGHLRGESRPQVFPLGRYDEKTPRKSEEIEVADWRSDEGLRVRKNGISPTLTLATPPYIVKSAALRTYPRRSNMTKEEKAKRYKRLEVRDDNVANTITCAQYDSIIKKEILDDYNAKIKDSVCGTLTQHCSRKAPKNGMKVIETNNDMVRIRKLTPVECARLQGFPDDWNDCQSDSQRYKQYGNAITTNLAESIFNKLYKEK